MDDSESSVDSSKLPENFVDQIESARTSDNMTYGESSAGITSATGQRSMLSQSIISLSFRSQSSTDSCDTIFVPRSTNARRSEACQNDQPGNMTRFTTSNSHDLPHSIRISSCSVSEVTREAMLLSPRQYPPLQVMDRSAANDPDRTSSPVYTPNNTPQKWSAASTESLFSLHEGRISSILMSNRPSLAAGPEAARTDDKRREQAGPSVTENITTEVAVKEIPSHINANVQVPEISSIARKSNGKIQPLPISTNRKHKKSSSCCKSLSCCSCSCKSLSCSCCCPSLSSCCSRPKSSSCCKLPSCSCSSCCKMPSCSCSSCCKMPSCSCSSCSLKWCCNWSCCSMKTCCSCFSCCSKWSCKCPKIGSCCPSYSSCSKAICCWNWSCWKVLCSWNCNCCGKNSCWRSWSCCSLGSCCKSWSCCCSKGCFSWNCCSKGACCSSWNCCKGSCCKSWKC